MDPKRAEMLRVLEQGAWFGSLPAELRRAVVERSHPRRHQRGETILCEGDPPMGMVGVVEGQVRATRWFDTENHSLIHVAGAGFWAGEIPTLLRCEQVASLVAQTEVLVVELSIAAFDQIVKEHADAYRHFARLAIERYAVLMRQISEILGLDGESLVRARLADLIDLRRSDDPAASAEITVPQAELAALVGVSRQTLSELLKRLEASGVIEVSYRKITVHDVERLRGDRPRTEIFRPWSPPS
jgi:CRP-like cAMP-binding protein